MVSAGTTLVPDGIEAVNAQWLTDALGSEVTDVRAEQIAMDSGFSSLLYRLHLTGEGVPATVIAKLPAISDARGAMDLMGGYRREVAFYQHIAGRAPMATPDAHVARIADNGVDFVLLLEDLAGWDNADHLAGLSMERARICLESLAGLHAWSCQPANRDVLEQFPSIDNPMIREAMVPAFGYGWQLYLEKNDGAVPPGLVEFFEHFSDRAPAALSALTQHDMLIHGDIRADNLFFDGDALKVVDFQFAARGSGVADLAYLVTQGLPIETRTGQDETLLREYLGHLAGRGVDYGFDAAWRDYRLAAVYLVLMPVVALLTWEVVPERSRRLCLTLTDRALAAIDEIQALEVFE
ncbi:putative homoserine kinase type II (protein kinase fold) [Mycolicibacterium rhodesiae NBB3]|uniref:Putative homoserine kinase type II (Protein kinase fold) n=1 Tax=Mycolicibacterium rhodesiae (strain NBB3) TaxID=710685 RepID=G8RRJ7_MYCRN|nr:putative homoserine kinase type II (protein kinase fold) [Mycolicibacterium rhodesiae NBB3]